MSPASAIIVRLDGCPLELVRVLLPAGPVTVYPPWDTISCEEQVKENKAKKSVGMHGWSP